MKKISRLLKYLADYKGQIALYFTANLLGILFGLFSLTMLAPVLQVLFKPTDTVVNRDSLLGKFSGFIHDIVQQQGPLAALADVCIAVVIFTILKNLFLYISLYILNPLRNAILRRLRDDIFTKTLSLPIGFFTEERKGDLISRMTNDINEVELSIMGVLEE